MARSDFGFQIGSALATNYLTDSKFVRAGYIAVDTIAERDALPVDTGNGGVIVDGSYCYVKATDKFYLYKNNAWAISENGKVDDVTMDGVSVVSNKVAALTTDAALANAKTTGGIGWTDSESVTHKIEPSYISSGQQVQGKAIISDGSGGVTWGEAGNVDDVKVNGTSVVSNKVADVNIKTVNNTSIIGTGNVDVGGDKLDITGGIIDVAVGTASTITPNPEGAATTSLNKLGIDNVIYQLGGGNVDDVKVDGTSVVDANKIAQISIVGKEDKANKVTTISSSSTDTEYPTAKAVFDTEQDIKEIAEGKTKSFVVSKETNPSFDTQDASFELSGTFTDINDVVHDVSELKLGDTVYVQETDVPDRWCSDPQEVIPVVPAPYVQQLYIDCEGGSYVDTGISSASVSADPKIETRFQMLSLGDIDWFGQELDGNGIVFDTNNQFHTLYIRWASLASLAWNFEVGHIANELYFNNPYTLKITGKPGEKAKIYRDDVLIATSTTNMNTMAAVKTITFNRGRASTGKGRWYSFKIYNGDTLAFNGIPARDADYHYGVYDTVSETFIQGTGTGITGLDLPQGVTFYKLETAKVPVTDVKMNGTSIVSNNVANIPVISNGAYGVIKHVSGQGLGLAADGSLYSIYANNSEIEAKSNLRVHIAPGNLDKAVMEGLNPKSSFSGWTDEKRAGARATINAEEADNTILKQANVVNETNSSSTIYPLSANMGKSLQDQVNNLKNIGRFLSIWNASTGAPTSEPEGSPYSYKVGDYYRVGTAGTKNPANNSTYTTGGTNWVEGGSLGIGDVVYVSNISGDTSTWVKQGAGSGGLVQDVQINGTTILDSGTGIANIPIASGSTSGVGAVNSAWGINVTDGVFNTVAANASEIEAKTQSYKPIVPSALNKAVMEGLGNNSLTWTDEYKASARTTIGAVDESALPNVVRL